MPTPLHRLADSYIPRFARTFEKSAKALRPDVTLEAVEADMARGVKAHPKSLYALVDQMVIAKADPEASAQTVYAELIASAGSLVAAPIVMDLDNPFVLDAAKKLTADLVTNVNAETKRALRQMIFEAIRDGDPPVVAQKQIREIVGLTKRDAMFVKKVGLEHPERVERLTAKLLRRRAINIARTETMRASHLGQKAAWQQMMADGLLDPTRFRQRWLVTQDDRTCDLCLPMDGLTVALDEDFESTERGVLPSERVSYEGDTVETPPLHPSCRCTLVADFGD